MSTTKNEKLYNDQHSIRDDIQRMGNERWASEAKKKNNDLALRVAEQTMACTTLFLSSATSSLNDSPSKEAFCWNKIYCRRQMQFEVFACDIVKRHQLCYYYNGIRWKMPESTFIAYSRHFDSILISKWILRWIAAALLCDGSAFNRKLSMR